MPYDLDAYANVLGNRDVANWLGRPEGISKEGTKQWINGMTFWWNKHGYGPWAVIEKESGALIGHCGLKFAEKLSATELMYAIHPDYQGKGYASEASKAALEFGKQQLKIDRIVAYTLPENLASRRVMEKLGMRFIKSFVHADLDHVMYEIEL